MSGGSWDYCYYKIEEIAERLLTEKQPERRALGKLLLNCSKALHDIEWVDSGDCGPGDEVDSIRAALGKNSKVLILNEAIDEAKSVCAQLQEMIDSIEKGTK